MKRILKYTVNFGQHSIIAPPGKVVLFSDQFEGLRVWIQIDSHAKPVKRMFCVAATGDSLPDSWEHVASAVCGEYVWHLHELPEVPRGA